MPLHRAPDPSREFFDPFNSSSTGHQRAESRLPSSTSWRVFRSHKLAHQFRDAGGGGGESLVADLVEVGSEGVGKYGRKENGSWEAAAPGLKEKGVQDIRRFMRGPRKRESEEVAGIRRQVCKRKRDDIQDGAKLAERHTHPSTSSRDPAGLPAPVSGSEVYLPSHAADSAAPLPPQIFRSLTLYLNGSTQSSGISDHKLKSLFVQHGGSISITLARRTVTHIVLGSEGGGLAAGKIQKEMAKVAGMGVRYVTAKWVVDSVECMKRQPESRYQSVHMAMKGQKSVPWSRSLTTMEHEENQ